jgi:hypothetical protein
MSACPVTVQGLEPWAILGLSPGASTEEVRGAVRLLAKAVHPDVLPRGAALFLIVQAAADACQNGGQWPRMALALPPASSPVPKPPPAPKPARETRVVPWRITRKGNWARKIGPDTWINVYLTKDGSGWRFLGPDADGQTYFDNETFDSAQAAMDAADDYFQGV